MTATKGEFEVNSNESNGDWVEVKPDGSVTPKNAPRGFDGTSQNLLDREFGDGKDQTYQVNGVYVEGISETNNFGEAMGQAIRNGYNKLFGPKYTMDDCNQDNKKYADKLEKKINKINGRNDLTNEQKANLKLERTHTFLSKKSDNIMENYKRAGMSGEDAMGHTIAFVAREYLDNVRVEYGPVAGNVYNYGDAATEQNRAMNGTLTARYDDQQHVTLYNADKPRLDCSGFVGLVLDTVGIKEPGFNSFFHGINNHGPGRNGVDKIVNSTNLFNDVASDNVKVGDIAYWDLGGGNGHIMIVSKVENGRATNYIHSAIDERPQGDGNGVQESFVNYSIRYKRTKGD